jgi:putative tricarboxylic transport membrane protein
MKLAHLSTAAAILLATIGTASAQAPAWKPNGTVSVVVHTGAGGGTDAFGRAILAALENDKVLQNNYVIVNKTGGGSTAAVNYLGEKAGDTNTIAIFSSVWVTDSLVQAEQKITINELTPIANLVLEPALFVVRADSPYKTLKDFTDAAKASPGKLKQAGGSVTARDAVVRFILMDNQKADWAYVSFPSGGERVAALLGGHVDIMMIEPSEAGELIRAGRLRAVAQVADARIKGFPDVPTLKEAGFDVPNVPQARGIVAPPNLPPEAVAYYEDLFKRASTSPSYVKYFEATQLDNHFLGSKELGAFIKEYSTTLRGILSGVGVKMVR